MRLTGCFYVQFDMEKITIGLLDLGYREAADSLTSFMQVFDYACAADKLGYSRFWLAEHHNSNIAAPFTNPEPMITLIAASTENINIGAAGMLLSIYEPYFIATRFKILNNLFFNRIDLGLAKGNPELDFINNTNDTILFNDNYSRLYDYLYNEIDNYNNRKLVLPPFNGTVPELWYLTSTYKNFNDIIRLKSNLCRSIMHGGLPEIIDYQKEQLLEFKGEYYAVHKCFPKIAVAVAVVIEGTIEKAKQKCNRIIKNYKINTSTITPIACTLNSLCDLLVNYQFLFGVDEFIIYDMDGNNDNKISNLIKISEQLTLKS